MVVILCSFVPLTISVDDGAHFDVYRGQLLISPWTVSYDKMCVNSCVVTTAYVFLLLAVLACALSYVAPFWILFPSGALNELLNVLSSEFSFYKTGTFEFGSFWVAGLWAACSGNKDEPECGWFWENDFYAEKRLPGWCCCCVMYSGFS